MLTRPPGMGFVKFFCLVCVFHFFTSFKKKIRFCEIRQTCPPSLWIFSQNTVFLKEGFPYMSGIPGSHPFSWCHPCLPCWTFQYPPFLLRPLQDLKVIGDHFMAYRERARVIHIMWLILELPNCASPPVVLHKHHHDHNLYQSSCCSLWLPIVSDSDWKH